MLKKILKIQNKKEFYIYHLGIINSILPIKMTKKEIITLASFMVLTEDLGNYVFDSTSRKLIRKENNLSFGNLSNILKSLKNKKFILEDSNGRLYINKILFPESYNQDYYFKIEYNGTN